MPAHTVLQPLDAQLGMIQRARRRAAPGQVFYAVSKAHRVCIASSGYLHQQQIRQQAALLQEHIHGVRHLIARPLTDKATEWLSGHEIKAICVYRREKPTPQAPTVTPKRLHHHPTHGLDKYASTKGPHAPRAQTIGTKKIHNKKRRRATKSLCEAQTDFLSHTNAYNYKSVPKIILKQTHNFHPTTRHV